MFSFNVCIVDGHNDPDFVDSHPSSLPILFGSRDHVFLINISKQQRKSAISEVAMPTKCADQII